MLTVYKLEAIVSERQIHEYLWMGSLKSDTIEQDNGWNAKREGFTISLAGRLIFLILLLLCINVHLQGEGSLWSSQCGRLHWPFGVFEVKPCVTHAHSGQQVSPHSEGNMLIRGATERETGDRGRGKCLLFTVEVAHQAPALVECASAFDFFSWKSVSCGFRFKVPCWIFMA